MKGLAFLGAILFLVGSLVGQAPQPSPADAALYGSYPSNYKEVVIKWLTERRVDFGSAKIKGQGEPQPADLGKNGEHVYGYLVQFRVNARNRFGTYTGMQHLGAPIKHGEGIRGLGLGY